MSYAGIDYGRGISNTDLETGIRYGVISSHSLDSWFYEEQEHDYGKPHCPSCGNEIVASDDDSLPEDADWNNGKDYACADCEKCFWSDSVLSEESLGWKIERDGYLLTNCLDSDVFVLKSPYFTYAQFCSPCVPGAGNLDSAIEDGVKTYCLGHDWFEDGVAPYPVYSVKTGELVHAEKSA